LDLLGEVFASSGTVLDTDAASVISGEEQTTMTSLCGA
jgi:hypothetical protein